MPDTPAIDDGRRLAGIYEVFSMFQARQHGTFSLFSRATQASREAVCIKYE
jgi:hypothetical protein